jgi:DNA-binding transcriptional MerR regulator
LAKKRYYKIGEVCKLLDIQSYVLRYWETEFPFLAPDKSKSGPRVYSEPELEVIRRIKILLYEEGYTIAGAKKKLETDDLDDTAAPGPFDAAETRGPSDAAETRGPSDAAETRPAGKKKTAAAKAAPARTTGRKQAPDAATLDNATREKVEKLRAGLKEALGRTRGILELMGSPSPPGGSEANSS